MSDLLKQLKTLVTPLVKHIEALEEYNQSLKNALSDLLEEEDVKLIPGYELLKITYEDYLDHEQLPSLVNDKTDPLLGYDPIHAPPNLRRKKKVVSIQPKTPTQPQSQPKTQPNVQTKVQPKRKSNYSSSMPDLDECMLGDTKQKQPESESAPDVIETEIHTNDDIGVYFVEIQGKQYYLYDNCFYDTETQLHCGELTSTGFKINGQTIKFTTEPVGLENDSISEDFPDFYSDTENKAIYKTIKLTTGTVVQSVGTIEDGKCMLW